MMPVWEGLQGNWRKFGSKLKIIMEKWSGKKEKIKKEKKKEEADREDKYKDLYVGIIS